MMKVDQVLEQLSNCIGKKQFDLNVGKNAWILKPGGKSRGRGIEIHTDLEDLLKSIMVSKDTIWVTQKYIEKPLIIIGKKFDMRVWILVTSAEPLKVWMFKRPYLRFTSEDYDPN
jgi:tubulin monoglycylase TTLL3/8